MRRFGLALGLAIVVAQSGTAQNLIQDGGFDGAPQTGFGNLGTADLPPWYFATVMQNGVVVNSHNLVAVDGPGGFDYADNGPESDASGAAAGTAQYYLDSGLMPQMAWQYFTPSCSGNATATVFLTNREGHGIAGGTLTGSDVPVQASPTAVFLTEGGVSIFPAPTTLAPFAPGFNFVSGGLAQQIQDLYAAHDANELRYYLGASNTQTAPWEALSHSVPVQAGQQYAFMAELGHSVNMDNVSVTLDCASDPGGTTTGGTGGAGTPGADDTTDVTITKTCTPPLAGQHNGATGMIWDCLIDVQGNLATAPQSGILQIEERPDAFGGSSVQTLSMTSTGGSADCSFGGVQTCLVGVGSYDPTVGEQIAVQLFLSGPSGGGTYTAENCAHAVYLHPTAPATEVSCVQIEWSQTVADPVQSSVKTCDPLTLTASGGYQLNCQITVTASGLAAGTFVMAADAFGALPPLTASVVGTMMNVTSNEPWNCVDDQLNAPGSAGICELAAADMQAAGGQSVIDVSFEFTADQDTGQVANCPISAIIPGSYVAASGQKSNKPELSLPGVAKSDNLPDGCVLLDLPQEPQPPLPPSVEAVSLEKSCGPMMAAQHNGVTGAAWSCEVTVTATPVPFAGVFTFTDDASAVTGTSNAQITAISHSSPGWSCTPGAPAQSTDCTISGSDFDASGTETVQFELFAETGGEPVSWTNCVDGVYAPSEGKDEEVKGNCETGTWTPTTGKTTFDVAKTCKAAGERQQFSNTGWFQPYSCTITVTTNGVPFSHPLWITEGLTYGPNNGNSTLQQITSNDPWSCTNAPYGVPGQANTNVPACAIQGAQFPHNSGTSSLDVTFVLQGGAADVYGVENCVGLNASATPATTPAEAEYQSCFEIIAPKPPTEPTLELTKTCGPAVQTGSDWTADCNVTVSGSDLPPGVQFRVTDELSGSGSTSVSSGMFNTSPLVSNNCGGLMIAGTQVTGCDLTTDDLIAGGGTITLPYTAILASSGGLSKPPAQNCAYVDIPSLGLHAPGAAGDKACVDIPLPVVAVDGGTTGANVLTDPAVPDTDGGLTVGDADLSVVDNFNDLLLEPDQPTDPSVGTSTESVLDNTILDDIVIPIPAEPALFADKTCAPAVSQGGDIWTLNCEITVTGSNLPAGEYVSVRDEIPQNTGIDVLASALTGGSNAICNSPQQCFILPPDMGPGATGLAGATHTFDYTATLLVPGALSGQNCVRAAILVNGSFIDTTYPGPSAPGVGYCVPITFDQSTVGDTGTGPNAGDTNNCSLDTLFVIDRSGSMQANNRMHLTKQAVFSALQIFEGGNSRSGSIMFGTNAYPIGGTSMLLPAPGLESAIQLIGPAGATNWKAAMREASLAVSGMADKPLVLFISDGEPTLSQPPAQPPTFAGFTDVAIPYVTSLRAQGSRVVGITIGANINSTYMTRLLGPNLVTAGPNTVVDPQTADVIEIPSETDIIRTFEQIAQAYCPQLPVMSPKKRADIESAMQSMPKSSGVYAGDDELPEPEQVASAPPILGVSKTQTGRCVIDRGRQTYDCDYRLSVTNQGAQPYSGTLVLRDQFGQPGVRNAALTSGGGWTCGTPVDGAVSCIKPNATLLPGQTDGFDLRAQVNGMRSGGRFENCAVLGVSDNRARRVALVQTIMNARGLDAGPVDGKPGRRTYAALNQLQEDLGLPVSREFGDPLFEALGVAVGDAVQSCAVAELAPMPAPPLTCDARTTVADGEACACRYRDMQKTSQTRCGCGSGFTLVDGEGCVKRAAPEVVAPTPEPGLRCDPRSTRLSGGECVCLDPRGARKTSATTCGCRNGLPMVGGRCVAVEIPAPGGDAAGGDCRIKVGGICIN